MNTVAKLIRKMSVLDGLAIGKLENSKDNLKCVTTANTVSEQLSSFDFDRTFNNIDIIEGMSISMLENPRSKVDMSTRVNYITPLKTYSGEIKINEVYNERNKY